MGCTTILVGKKATYDGSTMIARNDDSGAGHFTAKKFAVVSPKQQPKTIIRALSCDHRTAGESDALYSDAECGGGKRYLGCQRRQ